MVTKSKLKMALLAEKPVDFKKEHQKKMAKSARKEKKVKAKAMDEWEDVEEQDEEESVTGGVALDLAIDEEGSSEEEGVAHVRRA